MSDEVKVYPNDIQGVTEISIKMGPISMVLEVRRKGKSKHGNIVEVKVIGNQQFLLESDLYETLNELNKKINGEEE